MFNLKQQQREESSRHRGWIIYLLYKKSPEPLPAVSLWRLLDRENLYFSRRSLAKELDYLRGLRLIAAFPSGADKELDNVQQSKLVQRFGAANSDEEVGAVMWVRLTTAGVNFQDGITDHAGITRVE